MLIILSLASLMNFVKKEHGFISLWLRLRPAQGFEISKVSLMQK